METNPYLCRKVHMMLNQLPFLLLILLLAAGCKKEDPVPPPDYREFTSSKELKETFETLASIPDDFERNTRLSVLWDSLKSNQQIPFRMNDEVLFLYRENVASVSWAGDFNGWSANSPEYAGERLGATSYWMNEKQFPRDARLDYKVVTAGNVWKLDQDNPFVQYSGFGPNSELRMPEWVYPEETIRQPGVLRGNLSDNQLIQSISDNLNYTVQYKVYTPHGYEGLSTLPVIYVTDGHEYADDRLGSMIIVLDNLIHQQLIEPLIAVFVDPRNPANTGQNRRNTEYRANLRFANFLAEELVPQIDQNYKTNPLPEKRAILGTSLGGWNSAFVGIRKSETFRLIGIHSPAFDDAIISEYNNTEKLPLKIYMSTGVINDTEIRARHMRTVLESKGYQLAYKEVNEGHSWGNWRGLIDEPLLFFFGN
jgi:enterochelin esterase-like enzyme